MFGLDPILVPVLLAMGCFGGLAAGLLGIGGGMVLVPFMTMIFSARGVAPGLVVHMAIATSLATILFTSISSMRAHHRHGAVLWRVVGLLAPGIVVGSFIGPWIGKQMDTPALSLFFGLFVAFSATQMLFDKRREGKRPLPGTAGMLAAGGVIGVLSGLVGAGGGFVSIPFMTWRGIRIHNAVATSAALGFPIALAGTVANAWYGWGEPGLPPGALGFVWLPALVIIVAASMATAPVGARLAHRLPVQKLKKIFAVLLYALAAYMLWKAVY